MRLVTAGTRREWVWLEPETPAEATALQNCVAQGEWTNGRGNESIPRLRALSARLGYPVPDPNPPAFAYLVIVRRGEDDLFARMTAIVRDGVPVIWDRRQGERRSTDRAVTSDRRCRDRRQRSSEASVMPSLQVVPIHADA
jgi:hypothetical protein